MHPHEIDQRQSHFRTQILLRELGFSLLDSQINRDNWSIHFQDSLGFSGSATGHSGQLFLELGCKFAFSVREQDFLRDRMETFMQVCYRFGCYFLIQTENDQITISLFSKLYFSGLQYYALEETCTDLKNAVEEMRQVFGMAMPLREGEIDGHP